MHGHRRKVRLRQILNLNHLHYLNLGSDGSTSSITIHADFKADKDKTPEKTKTADRRVSAVSVHKAVPTSSGLSNGAVNRSSSFEDGDSRLETEYIHRFLGQLTPLEVSLLGRRFSVF